MHFSKTSRCWFSAVFGRSTKGRLQVSRFTESRYDFSDILCLCADRRLRSNQRLVTTANAMRRPLSPILLAAALPPLLLFTGRRQRTEEHRLCWPDSLYDRIKYGMAGAFTRAKRNIKITEWCQLKTIMTYTLSGNVNDGWCTKQAALWRSPANENVFQTNANFEVDSEESDRDKNDLVLSVFDKCVQKIQATLRGVWRKEEESNNWWYRKKIYPKQVTERGG